MHRQVRTVHNHNMDMACHQYAHGCAHTWWCDSSTVAVTHVSALRVVCVMWCVFVGRVQRERTIMIQNKTPWLFRKVGMRDVNGMG